MPLNKMEVHEFAIEHPGERAAGINPYYNEVRVLLEYDSGDAAEFNTALRQFLYEWFDGASVVPKDEYDARVAAENAADDEAWREAEALARTEDLP